MSLTALSPSVEEIFALVDESLHAVKNSLLAMAPPDSGVLAETIQYALSGGGKYLRPAVTLLCGAATREERRIVCARTVEVAAVAEMIHVATLLHDDVIDRSGLRRGKKTVRARWGDKVSVLGGDYLLAQASIKLSRLGDTRLVSIFAHVLADLCDGEVEQMHTSFSLNTSWDSYYKKIMCKTASLFSAGCEATGVVNQLPELHIQALKTYGRNFGVAFQIMDDLLDYTATEAEMGKPVLDDLRNGLLTAPVLLALESDMLSLERRTLLKTQVEMLFTRPAEETEEIITRIRELLNDGGAVAQTRLLVDRYIREAREALDFVAISPERNALLGLLDYITARRH